MQKPKIVIDNLPEESFFEIYKDEDRMLINHQIRNQNAEKQFLERGIIEQSYFEHVKFNQSDFYRLELTDSIFVGCDFSNCKKVRFWNAISSEYNIHLVLEGIEDQADNQLSQSFGISRQGYFFSKPQLLSLPGDK